jgi:hypothetical protein
MYNLNFAYDSVIINIKLKNGGTEQIFSTPGFESGDYVNWFLQSDAHHANFLFCMTKNQAEAKYGIKFPLELKEGDYSLFSEEFLNKTKQFRSTDESFFNKLNEVNVQRNTVDYFLKTGQNFIYPYVVVNEISFQKDLPHPPQSVIDAVKRGQCKIVLFYGAEGHTYSLHKLSKIIKLTKELGVQVYFYCSNIILGEKYKEWCNKFPDQTTPLLTIPKYVGFENDPWFMPLDRTDYTSLYHYTLSSVQKKQDHITTKNLINSGGIKKFLVFNRRPRLYRVLIHSAIKSSQTLDYNSYTGLEKFTDLKAQLNFFKDICSKIPQGGRIYEYLLNNVETYTQKGYELDANLEENQAFSFPMTFYYNTLISVVTETETEKDCVFFSEKIFKPIVALHPFIVISNKNFLKELKELGYKTFSDFWDESYDEIDDETQRFNAILKLIEDLNKKPIEELKNMYFNMIPILEHNHKLFFTNTRLQNTLTDLCRFTPSNSNNLI